MLFHFMLLPFYVGDVVALLVGHRTWDLQVAGSSPGRAPLRSGFGQATYTCVPLSPSSVIWYWTKGSDALAENAPLAWQKVMAAYCQVYDQVTCMPVSYTHLTLPTILRV